jgi:diaminopimelate decarboxylase
MEHFILHDGQWWAEQVPLAEIAARHGTPCYVYSRATIEQQWRAFDAAFSAMPHLVCYAVKANSNLAVLNLMARLGSGFDIVSHGELERVLAAGGRPDRIVFSGVGKSAAEIRRALQAGIHCFNVESAAELARIDALAAELGMTAPVSLRVNPDIDAGTHPYISTGLKENKFGIDIAEAEPLYLRAAEMAHLRVIGIDCHIGSQLTSLAPFRDALQRVGRLVERLAAQGLDLQHIDIGGGLGIRYHEETPPAPQEYAATIREVLGGHDVKVILEPGRAIVGNAGVLLTRVEYLKHSAHKNFAIVDAAMNDLLRPALYQAWQDVVAVQPHDDAPLHRYDIVGPVCETGDFLARDRELRLAPGDLLAVRSCGAYGFTMSSNYNSRPRAAEIMVDDAHTYVIRQRERLVDLMAGETLLPAPD